jgi:hypothetical protein
LGREGARDGVEARGRTGDDHQYFDRKPKFVIVIVIVPKYDKMVVGGGWFLSEQSSQHQHQYQQKQTCTYLHHAALCHMLKGLWDIAIYRHLCLSIYDAPEKE